MQVDEFLRLFEEAVDFPTPVEMTPETVIYDLDQWDSLAQLGVIVMFDVEFGKVLTAQDIELCKTIDDLYKFSQA